MKLNTDIISLWYKYNDIFKSISRIMGGTNNIVGEFAEKIACLYYDAKQMTASQHSYDIITNDNKKIQVKSRRLDKLVSTQLNVIRSWDFNLLLVIIFSESGTILKAIEISSEHAKKYSKINKHQNGWIITTNNDFLNSPNAKDVTNDLNNLLK